MVLPSLLRYSPRHSAQALRRARHVWFHPDFVLLALARYVAGALGHLSPDLQAVLLAVRVCRHRSRLSWLQAAGGRLCSRGTHSHRLLLPAIPGDIAARRASRETQTIAAVDFRSGLGQEIGQARAPASRVSGKASCSETRSPP